MLNGRVFWKEISRNMPCRVTFFTVLCWLKSIADCYGAVPCVNHDDCGGVQCPTGYAPYCATILFSHCKCSQSDATWSAWNHWSDCSVTCGTNMGSRSRQRRCLTRASSHDICVGNSHEAHSCRATSSHCPRDGHWGNWLPWSACSVSCGTGTKHRQRTCNNPTPANGGSFCSGYLTDNQPCSTSCTTTTTTTTMTTTPAPTTPPGKPCPSCDQTLTCVWNQTCTASETCMVRAVTGHGFQFTIHCIPSEDCHFMTTYLSHSEIYCCDDRACLHKYVGV
ncbi:coadhesin-like [Ostrea edulis]|uniref:coadhesin-like n=1 Tax=Ostrea edulis TaxID=37623 RepID=UPI0024AFF53A|nr:coadhesin-like [Ostrea edulis]